MTSRRRSPLPPGWKKLRLQVLKRDGWQCRWIEHGVRCVERATDVDHIGDRDAHSLDNLRSLCGFHHRHRTAKQASDAAAVLREQQARRRDRGHPGDVK